MSLRTIRWVASTSIITILSRRTDSAVTDGCEARYVAVCTNWTSLSCRGLKLGCNETRCWRTIIENLSGASKHDQPWQKIDYTPGHQRGSNIRLYKRLSQGRVPCLDLVYRWFQRGSNTSLEVYPGRGPPASSSVPPYTLDSCPSHHPGYWSFINYWSFHSENEQSCSTIVNTMDKHIGSTS